VSVSRSLMGTDGRSERTTNCPRRDSEVLVVIGRGNEEVESDPVAVVPPLRHLPRTQAGPISPAARDFGEGLNTKALVAVTQSGDTVRRLGVDNIF
jgi:hypothetical protein